ncbi:MAG: MFS transporter [Gemmatimonadota bacterium]|nr:MFS transporter [Gemmatimonadota bacterium]
MIHLNRDGAWAGGFFTIWTGQTLSSLGTQVAQFALVWWLTEKTGSATILATSVLVAYLPEVFLAPIIGTLNDRWNRRIVMLVSDTLVAIAMAGLAGLFWMEIIEIWHIYAVNFLASIGRAFQGLAMITSTPLMVPEKHLARIQGTNQTLHGVLSMGGPPLGALALALFEIHIILAIDVLTAMLAIGPLIFIMIPQPKRMEEKQSQEDGIWVEMLEGFRYLWRWIGLRNLILIAAVLNIFGNTKMTISPLLITDHFNGGATELGWFNSTWGVGIVLGGLLVGAWGGFRRRIMTTILGWIVYGIGTILVGIVPHTRFALAITGIALSGVGSSLINAPLRALLQANVDPHLQGRVFGALHSSVQFTTMLGLIVIGPVTDVFGPQPWFLTGGLLTLVLGTSVRMIPSVVSIEDKKT